MKLKLTPKDLKDFKSFENAVKNQLGKNTYVGTDSMVVVLDYPKQLQQNLRPYPEVPITKETTFEW
jgi:hypothetical protein